MNNNISADSLRYPKAFHPSNRLYIFISVVRIRGSHIVFLRLMYIVHWCKNWSQCKVFVCLKIKNSMRQKNTRSMNLERETKAKQSFSPWDLLSVLQFPWKWLQFVERNSQKCVSPSTCECAFMCSCIYCVQIQITNSNCIAHHKFRNVF